MNIKHFIVDICQSTEKRKYIVNKFNSKNNKISVDSSRSSTVWINTPFDKKNLTPKIQHNTNIYNQNYNSKNQQYFHNDYFGANNY